MLIYINKTRVQKLTFLIIPLAISFLVLLFFQRYVLSIVVFLLLIILSRIWYLEIVEELIIYALKKAGGEKNIDSILDEYNKKGKSAINRLTNKRVIKVENKIVKLIDVNRPCPFTRP